MIAEAETAGVIEPGEREMIAGVMRLGDRPVRAVMTPRREVDMVDLSRIARGDPQDHLSTACIRACRHTTARPRRWSASCRRRTFSTPYMRGEQPDIRALVRPAPTIPDTADALDVLEIIQGFRRAPRGTSCTTSTVTPKGSSPAWIFWKRSPARFETEKKERPSDQAIQRDDGSWLLVRQPAGRRDGGTARPRAAGGAELRHHGGFRAAPLRLSAGRRRRLRAIGLAVRSDRSRWPAYRQDFGQARSSSSGRTEPISSVTDLFDVEDVAVFGAASGSAKCRD